MKIVLQKVKQASVETGGREIARIQRGFCLLIGVEKGDSGKDVRLLAKKITGLRIFPDSEGKMNRSLQDVKGDILAISQFTLAGSVKKGRRPSFDHAEDPDKAEPLFQSLVRFMRDEGFNVSTGRFGALMDVHLINEGPVTFVLSS
jgi:D-aminoacyl-tRNA deacylase